jgi:pimeloyl-ACP methyl ester carboxylesterase
MRFLAAAFLLALTQLLGPAENSKQYLDCSNSAETQSAMNACADQEFARAHTELNHTYRALRRKPRNNRKPSHQRMANFEGWSPDEIRSIQAPTLIMLGDRDIVRPEHAVEMFRLLPHAQLAVLPGTDHMTIVKRAEWQVSMVEAFLNAPAP